MPACPAGHESAATDYCDTCGRRMGAPLTPSASAVPCPQCGTPGLERFCEACGYEAGPDPVPGTAEPAATPVELAADPDDPGDHKPVTTWTAVVTASRPHYDAMITAGGPDMGKIPFPEHCPERRFPLNGPKMRIGRRSVSRYITPEIDLTGPPADPGVSHLHANLIALPDGSWAVVDLESENGTTVNSTEIPPGVPVPLRDGDSIFIGAWTAITVTGPA